MIIYLTGIDGSGKSTITEKLLQEFKNRNIEVTTMWARYNPNFVKKLISPFKKKFVSDTKKDHLMDGNQYSDWSKYKKRITKNALISKSLFLLQAVDYLQQLKKYKKIIADHHNKMIVIDRYLLDFIVDESVNYGNIENSFITKRFLKRLKKIDHIFFIQVSEQTAMSRKNDIPSLEYLIERKKIYNHYIKKLGNSHIINNDTNIANTLHEIVTIINNN